MVVNLYEMEQLMTVVLTNGLDCILYNDGSVYVYYTAENQTEINLHFDRAEPRNTDESLGGDTTLHANSIENLTTLISETLKVNAVNYPNKADITRYQKHITLLTSMMTEFTYNGDKLSIEFEYGDYRITI